MSNVVQDIFFLSDEQVPTNFMQGRVEILLVASCYRNWDKLQHDRPLGSSADFSNFTFGLKIRESRDILRELKPACCNAYAKACCTGQFVLPVLIVTFVTVNIGAIAHVLTYSLKLLKVVFSERDAFSYCTLYRGAKFNASGHKCSEACCGFRATRAKMLYRYTFILWGLVSLVMPQQT